MATYSYGGQFHLDIKGMKEKILIGGHGIQQILIDVENSRISFKYNSEKSIIIIGKKYH